MSDGISFDFSELESLAADLGEVAPTAGPFINSAVQFTSREIKKSAAKKVRKRKHFGQAASAIDYDVEVIFGQVITSDIGYNKDRDPGKLGWLVEHGAPNSPNALTPGNELVTSLHEQEEDFEHGLSKALADAEKKAGLTQ